MKKTSPPYSPDEVKKLWSKNLYLVYLVDRERVMNCLVQKRNKSIHDPLHLEFFLVEANHMSKHREQGITILLSIPRCLVHGFQNMWIFLFLVFATFYDQKSGPAFENLCNQMRGSKIVYFVEMDLESMTSFQTTWPILENI